MNFQKIIQSFKEKLSRKKAPEFEIFLNSEQEVEVEVKEQKLNALNASESMGASIRVIVDKRLGFAYTTDFSESSLEKVVEQALATAQYSNQREFLQLATKQPEAPSMNLRDFDKNFSTTSQNLRLQKAMEMEKAALSLDSKIQRVRGASFAGSLSEVFLVNSWGVERHHRKTMNVLSLMAVAEEEKEAEGVFEFGFSSFLEELIPEEIGEKAAQKALRYLGGKPGKTLKGPVLLDPLVAAEILEVLAPSFFADNLIKKRSLFEGKQNQKILSSNMTLIDDACFIGAYASFPFDGEGMPSRSTRVVEGGVFKSPLADLEYGARLGLSSTGSSERESMKRPPQIGHSNFYVQPGKFSFEELVKKTQRGVYITELIGMHTASPISGDFSVGAQGFLIEGGEVKHALKQMALSGNLKEMMNRVQEVGSDLRFYFKVGSPTLLIEEMDVAGA